MKMKRPTDDDHRRRARPSLLHIVRCVTFLLLLFDTELCSMCLAASCVKNDRTSTHDIPPIAPAVRHLL